MEEISIEPICRQSFEAQTLATNFPPRPRDRNKRIVFGLAAPPGARHAGTISFSRWRQLPLPETLRRSTKRPSFVLRDDYFTYDPTPEGQVDWYLNFANHDLFSAYAGPLFAQDEMQVAEHPALVSLRYALMDAGIDPLSVEDGVATPALIMGVERWCAIATDPNAGAGRPHGLYGNQFSVASEAAVRQATRVLAPPTKSNLIAMEAPAYGSGRYTREEIAFIAATAYTGYYAAVQASRAQGSPAVHIHTGYWGCGAYGGNRGLMPLLQLIAACAAGVDTLVFHSGGDASGYRHSLEKLEAWLPVETEVETEVLLHRIVAAGYEWGVSDGT